MFTRLLIGLDGGEGGRDALALARRLATPEAHLVLANVWSHGAAAEAAVAGRPHPAALGHDVLQAERLASGLDRPGIVHPAPSTAAGLRELAEELDCDLLVVGSSSRQPPGRVFVRDHARAALHGAPCAVAVAPRGFAASARSIDCVGVGYGQAPIAAPTLGVARELATDLDAELRVVHVVAPLSHASGEDQRAFATEIDALVGEDAQRAATGLDPPEDHETRVLLGDPVTALRELSAEVDLLVLGSRAHGPLRRMLLGSTSDQLVHEASCPVLVLARASSSGDGPRGRPAVARA